MVVNFRNEGSTYRTAKHIIIQLYPDCIVFLHRFVFSLVADIRVRQFLCAYFEYFEISLIVILLVQAKDRLNHGDYRIGNSRNAGDLNGTRYVPDNLSPVSIIWHIIYTHVILMFLQNIRVSLFTPTGKGTVIVFTLCYYFLLFSFLDVLIFKNFDLKL